MKEKTLRKSMNKIPIEIFSNVFLWKKFVWNRNSQNVKKQVDWMSLKKLSVQSQQSKYTIKKKTENLKYSFGSCSGAHESWPRITNSFWLSRKVCAKTTSANISFRFIKKPHGLNLLSYCVQALKLLKLNYFLLRVL